MLPLISLLVVAALLIIMVSYKDWLFASLYLTLFLYTIITQIALGYFPEIISGVGLVYSEETEFYYWGFVDLSLVCIAVLRVFIIARRRAKIRQVPHLNTQFGGDRGAARIDIIKRLRMQDGRDFARIVTVVGFFGYVIILLLALLLTRDQLGYARDIAKIPSYTFFLVQIMAVALYGLARVSEGTGIWRKALWFIFILLATLLSYTMITAGKRLQVVAFLNGVILFELLWADRNRKIVIRGMLIGGICLFGLLTYSDALVAVRGGNASVSLANFQQAVLVKSERQGTFLERLIANDALVPSMLLLEAIEKQVIVPAEVSKSVLLNMLVFTDYPQMNELMGNRIRPDFTRNESYAYYLLNEGYQMAGWWGILYNAIVINLGFLLWESIYRGKDIRLIALHTAIIATLFIVTVRAGSFWFVKGMYLGLIPVSILCRYGVRAIGLPPK